MEVVQNDFFYYVYTKVLTWKTPNLQRVETLILHGRRRHEENSDLEALKYLNR
jgi:hypothetical protein